MTLRFLLGNFGIAATMVSTSVLAKDPISQCIGPGQALSGANFVATSGAAQTRLSISSEERPDGLVYPVGPKFQALLPKATSSIDLGEVNLKTGSYSFTNQDISIGQGHFPARLFIERTYDSVTADSAPDQINSPRFGPGAPDIKYFGIGSTHNLDLRYRSGLEAFGGGPAYTMIYVSMGMRTLIFQKCANGEYLDSRGDGNRLFPIGSAPNAPPSPGGGYRLELKDGTRVYFFAEGARVCVAYDDFTSQSECGWASRWEAPNGDWANFYYTKYYDRPDRAINQHLQTDHRVDSYDNSQQLCIATVTMANDCRQIDSTYYHFHDSQSGGLETRTNNDLNSYRISYIQNSRGFKLEFSYLDNSTDVGGICPFIGDYGFLVCVDPPKNIFQQRGQINQISAIAGSSLVKSVSYQYASNTLHSFSAVDGAVTKYQFPDANQVGIPQKLKIFLPTDHQNPAVSVDMVLSNGAHFQHLPVGIWQSGFAPHDFRRYPRATKQTFADGRVIEYQATLNKKWRTRSTRWHGYGAPVTYWTPVEYISKMNVVEAGAAITSYRFDDEDAPLQVTDPLARNTFNTYDDVGNLLTSTLPEGNSIALTYDARGNVVQRITHPKAGSGLSALTEATSYLGAPTVRANACPNQLTCNRPSSSTDARGAVASYAWDPTTGLMTSEILPADSSGNHPTRSFGYTDFTAPLGGNIRLLTSETVATVPGQQTTTTYGYDPANRYLPKEVVVTSGAESLRTCIKLGPDGTPISETKPNANLTSCP